jgi:hypothetical protein
MAADSYYLGGELIALDYGRDPGTSRAAAPAVYRAAEPQPLNRQWCKFAVGRAADRRRQSKSVLTSAINRTD